MLNYFFCFFYNNSTLKISLSLCSLRKGLNYLNEIVVRFDIEIYQKSKAFFSHSECFFKATDFSTMVFRSNFFEIS